MIREMKISDAARAAEIHVFGWRTAYRGIVSDAFLFNQMQVVNRIKHFENAVINHTEESYVFDDGIIKAILTIGACRDGDKSSCFELWGIYVDSFMQKQGIGTKMMRFCEEQAISRGYPDICLWVLEENASARSFYEKYGFAKDGTRKLIKSLDVYEIRYVKKLSNCAQDMRTI